MNDGSNSLYFQNQIFESCLDINSLSLQATTGLSTVKASLKNLNGSFESFHANIGFGIALGKNGIYGNLNSNVYANTIEIPEVYVFLKNGNYWNKSISGYCVGGNASLQLPKECHSVKIDPFYSVTTFKAEEGSFYAFKGKIYIPYGCLGGIRISLLNQNIDFAYGLYRGYILSNDLDELLFQLNASIFYADWIGNFEIGRLKIGGKAGFFRGAFDTVGYLTYENQRYFTFPYKYNWISANGFLNLIFTGMNVSCKFDFLTGCLGSDFFYVPNSSFDATQIYEKRNVSILGLDGSYGTSDYNSEIFSNLCFMIPYVALNADCKIGRSNLNIELKKEILVLLSMNKEFNNIMKDFDSDNFLSLKSLLLSGLSINLVLDL